MEEFQIKKSYDVQVVDAGLAETKDGGAQPFITFKFDNGKTMNWYGSMKSDKSKEFTAKALITAGFVGNDFSDLSAGYTPMNFQGVNVTVELEHPQDKSGAVDTKKFRIKWINRKSTGVKKFQGTVEKSTALFAKLKQELGVKKTDDLNF